MDPTRMEDRKSTFHRTAKRSSRLARCHDLPRPSPPRIADPSCSPNNAAPTQLANYLITSGSAYN